MSLVSSGGTVVAMGGETMAKLVVVDPGHGGHDPGATGQGLAEKTLTLALGKHLHDALLRDFDVRVELTRSTDVFVELDRRAAFANERGADYFVSVHINSGGGTGYEDFVHRSVSSSSATEARRAAVHQAVMQLMQGKGMPDRGKKSANFAVLRETQMPAILTENLFVDTPQDAHLLRDVAFLEALAEAHARGIGAALSLPPR
jgi:N-acetylmuramoyl-L-alanine amidase